MEGLHFVPSVPQRTGRYFSSCVVFTRCSWISSVCCPLPLKVRLLPATGFSTRSQQLLDNNPSAFLSFFFGFPSSGHKYFYGGHCDCFGRPLNGPHLKGGRSEAPNEYGLNAPIQILPLRVLFHELSWIILTYLGLSMPSRRDRHNAPHGRVSP